MTKDDIRSGILASDDLKREPVDVPWDLGGAKLYVRALTGDEKDQWYAETMPDGEFHWRKGMSAGLLVKTLVDEAGEQIFTEDDREALGKKDAAVLTELVSVAMRLSGLQENTQEVIEEHFVEAQDGASVSA
jgi:hypothetical protein